MRETRLCGSEGGEAKAFPTPITAGNMLFLLKFLKNLTVALNKLRSVLLCHSHTSRNPEKWRKIGYRSSREGQQAFLFPLVE